MRVLDTDNLRWISDEGADRKEITPAVTLLRVKGAVDLPAGAAVILVLRGDGQISVGDETVIGTDGVACVLGRGEGATLVATAPGRSFLCLWTAGGTGPEPADRTAVRAHSEAAEGASHEAMIDLPEEPGTPPPCAKGGETVGEETSTGRTGILRSRPRAALPRPLARHPIPREDLP